MYCILLYKTHIFDLTYLLKSKEMPEKSTQNYSQMKTSFFLTAFCLISLSAFIMYSKFVENNDDISISIKDTDDNYRLDASYNRGNSVRVLQYINRNLEGNHYFETTTRRIDVTTRLHDNTEYYIKES